MANKPMSEASVNETTPITEALKAKTIKREGKSALVQLNMLGEWMVSHEKLERALAVAEEALRAIMDDKMSDCRKSLAENARAALAQIAELRK